MTYRQLEWDCQDCGIHVFAFAVEAVPDPPRCATCAWLVEHVPDPVEQAALRAQLCDYLP